MAASKIFISYRREDAAWAARAVYERLRQEFAKDVFIDIETIGLGKKFAAVIDAHLEGCNVMLAMIGPTWEAALVKRLTAGTQDHVRIEIARALAKGIPVVPVLIDRRELPEPDALPEDLGPLLEFNGLVLEAQNFDDRMKSVVRAVAEEIEARGAAAAAPTAPAVIAKPSQPAHDSWMSGRDMDSYGHWAEFTINKVVQRLRWIPSGEFLMGSTDAERKRFLANVDRHMQTHFDDEKPRHRVSLTRGFWLADTACTQALWQTVVGDNPSNFSGDLQLPVERVSWDDVTQRFLPAISKLFPEVQVALPTEAQWEYACRAGSETTFAFGEDITTDQVNFEGTTRFSGLAKGVNRKRTEPVKALACNAWGLYQMHGNVWEWCEGGKREYRDQTEVDPPDVVGSERRALRGGSWNESASTARSACRWAIPPVTGRGNIGFRLAMKHHRTEGGA